MKRHKMKKKYSKKLFSRTAKKVNRRNVGSSKRGGIRF